MTAQTRRRCLVTGGTGFVGRATAEALRRAGHDVTTLSRSMRGAPDAARHLVHDLAAGPVPMDVLAGFEAIVHLVAALPGDPPAHFTAINVTAAGLLAAAARQAGCARFVLLSSTRAVTANGARLHLTDDDAAEPGDPYGVSKREGEIAVAAAFPDATILRPPLILGAGMRGAMAKLAALARAPLPLPFASLTAERSYIAAADLADAIRHAVETPALAGRTALAASPGTLSIAGLVGGIRRARGRSPGLIPCPAPLIAGAVGLALGPDAAAALTRPLTLAPSRLAASGWQAPHGLAAALADIARGAA